jgi:hypothetical protein
MNELKIPYPPGIREMKQDRIIMIIIIFILGGVLLWDFTTPKTFICRFTPEVNVNVTVPKIEMGARNIQAPHDFDIDSWSAINALVRADIIDRGGGFYGSSMQPAIFEGNTLLMVNASDIVLQPGDIIRYVSDNGCVNDTGAGPVIHRIVGIYRDYIMVQGDNNGGAEKIFRCQVTDKIIGILFT